MEGIPLEFHKYSSGVLENLLVVLSIYSDERCEHIINPIHKKDGIISPRELQKNHNISSFG